MTAATMQVGRYRVSAVLGTGGFGTVYLARDRGRPVAVKVLDRAARSDPRTMAGVRTEAAAMRRVRDRHCVRVLDVIDEETVTALVTEFVDGASLRAVLDRHGPLDGRQALDVMRGALLGLSAVHRAGMVHGDVKPANILLDRRGRARLIDFGLARDVGASAGSSDLTGSPAYMAPEQIRRLPPDPRSDIYACAAVLYELLTGRRPMQADTIPGVLRMHLEVAPADPRSINPEISPALAALCLSGLAKNPAERPQSARAFLDQLERAAKERYGAAWRRGLGLGALAGTTAAALGRGQLGRAGRRLVRLPQVAVGAGTAAVIVAGVVVATNHHTPKRASAAPSSSAAASAHSVCGAVAPRPTADRAHRLFRRPQLADDLRGRNRRPQARHHRPALLLADHAVPGRHAAALLRRGRPLRRRCGRPQRPHDLVVTVHRAGHGSVVAVRQPDRIRHRGRDASRPSAVTHLHRRR